MGWNARLELTFRRDGERTVAHDRHEGPLRVLRSLYPEAASICHQVLVHPPGGIVGGDVLDVDAALGVGSHALLTTPGAARFYRSAGELATQRLRARLAPGARLEWLPLETIAHSGCRARNHVRFELAPGAEVIGWDILALGLPASGEAFARGSVEQQIELPGRWLERGVIDGADMALLDSPLGLAGHRVLGTLWFAAGSEIVAARREAIVDAALEALSASPLARQAGCSAPIDAAVVLRVLADRVEPAMQLMAAVWARWRTAAWALAPCAPRVWRT